jgi:cytochrome c-type biogenesis protein CcmH
MEMTLPRGNPLLIFAVLLFVGLVVTGCASSSGPLSAEELELTAQGIDKGLMCPICPSETIDQSQVEIANQMQIMVREKLAQGESSDAIYDFFVDRYGLGILAEPPKSGFNLLIWVIPPMALLLGSVILTLTVRSMRREHHRHTEDEALPSSAELEPYLAAVDQEIQRLTQTRGGDAEQPDTPPESPDIKTYGGRAE